jgi:hypothetical protein
VALQGEANVSCSGDDTKPKGDGAKAGTDRSRHPNGRHLATQCATPKMELPMVAAALIFLRLSGWITV